MNAICDELIGFLRERAGAFEPSEGRLFAIPVDRAIEVLSSIATVHARTHDCDGSELGGQIVESISALRALMHGDDLSLSTRVGAIKQAAMALRNGMWNSDQGVAACLGRVVLRQVEEVLEQHVCSRHLPTLRCGAAEATQFADWRRHWVRGYWNSIAAPCGLPERTEGLDYCMTPPADQIALMESRVRELTTPESLVQIYLKHLTDRLQALLHSVDFSLDLAQTTGVEGGASAAVFDEIVKEIRHFAPGVGESAVLLQPDGGARIKLNAGWRGQFLQHVVGELRYLRWVPPHWTAPSLSQRMTDKGAIVLRGLAGAVWASRGEQVCSLELADIASFERSASAEHFACWRDLLVHQYLLEHPNEWNEVPEEWKGLPTPGRCEQLVVGEGGEPECHRRDEGPDGLNCGCALGQQAPDAEAGSLVQCCSSLARHVPEADTTAACLLRKLHPDPDSSSLLVQAVAQADPSRVREVARWLGGAADQPPPMERSRRTALQLTGNFIDRSGGSVLCALASTGSVAGGLEEVVDALVRLTQTGWIDRADLYHVLEANPGAARQNVFHVLAQHEALAPILQRLLMLGRRYLGANESMALLTGSDGLGHTPLSLALESDAPVWSDSVEVLLKVAANALEQADCSVRQILEFCLAKDPGTEQPALHRALLSDRVGAVGAWVAELPAYVAAAALAHVGSGPVVLAGSIQRQALAGCASRAVMEFRAQAVKRLVQIGADRGSILAVLKDVYGQNSLLRDNLQTDGTTTWALAPVVAAFRQGACSESLLYSAMEWHVTPKDHWVYQAISDQQAAVVGEWLDYCSQLLDTHDDHHGSTLQQLLLPSRRPPLADMVTRGLHEQARRYVEVALAAAKEGMLDTAALIRLLAVPATAVVDMQSADVLADVAARLVQGRLGARVLKEADRMFKLAKKMQDSQHVAGVIP